MWWMRPGWMLTSLLILLATGVAQDRRPGETISKPPVDSQRVALNPQGTVLLDAANKKLILKGEICLREGFLEMLACLHKTKEHESIIKVKTEAQVVHAGLLALEAEAGKPVQFRPEYKPATGEQIEIFVSWKDQNGKEHREPASYWIRHATRRFFVEKLDMLPPKVPIAEMTDLRYDPKHKELFWYGTMPQAKRDEWKKYSSDKAYLAAIDSIFQRSQLRQMKADWVFAGSSFYIDEMTGKKSYNAESGDLICVANFTTAMLDLSIPSSASTDGLEFEAWTERIPPLGTAVEVELIPRFKEKPKPAETKPKAASQVAR